MGNCIPFTEQQWEDAGRTDLAAFLQQCGEGVKRSGSENMWFHQYEQVGGDAIDFVCRFYHMDDPEAVQLMISMVVLTRMCWTPSPIGILSTSPPTTTMPCLWEQIRQDTPRHIHKHHTAAQGGFKGNEAGSEPEYCFHRHGGGGVLYFFEAPIDMQSFISQYKHCWKSQSDAAACGVSDRVLWQILKDRPTSRRCMS